MPTQRFPTGWLDELYSRADIVQIVSAYLPLKRDGRRYWGLCPFHHEKTPSFSVTPELNLYYCFGCKAGGNVVQFVMEMEKLSYHEAILYLADKLHMQAPQLIEDPDYERRRSERERLLAANKEAAAYFYRELWTERGKPMLDYFYRRGLSDAVIRRFGLGASLDEWDDLTLYLTQKGFSEAELRSAGLIVTKEGGRRFDFFRGRAMFPIIDQFGNVLAFGGRTLGNDQPKYLNTGDTPIFNKRLGVFAANLLKKERNLQRVILVEGYMDVVALSQAGVAGVAATLGTSLTPEQARLLKRFAPEIWVSYDGDEAGQHAIERALSIFDQEGIPARVLYLPDQLDPDEFIRQRGREAFDEIRPMSPYRYRLMRLEKASDLGGDEGRVAYVKQAATIVKPVRDPVELEVYVRDICRKSGFEREVVLAQIGTELQQVASPAARSPAVRARRVERREEAQEGTQTEQTIVALLASGLLPKDMVRPEDVQNETLRLFVERLNAGEQPAAILSDAAVQDRELAARVFSQPVYENTEDAVTIASDCLKRLRQERLRQQLEAAKKEAAETSDENVRQNALQQIMRLTAEISRLK